MHRFAEADSKLRGLAVAIDSDRVAPRLGAALRAAGVRHLEVTRCAVERLRYRRGTRALVLYAVELRDHRDGSLHPVWVGGSLLPGDRAARLARRAGRERGAEPGASTTDLGTLHDPELDLLWQFFPTDRHLPHLRAVAFPTRAVRAALLAPTFADAAVDITCTRYRPGIGAALRAVDRHRGALYLKVYPAGASVAVMARAASLARTGGPHDTPTLVLPRWHAESVSALAVPAARGRSLDALVADPAADVGVAARRAADALHRFHASPVDPGQTESRDAVATSARHIATNLAQALPECEGELGELARAIAARLPATEPRPTHLDLKPDHVFLDDDRVSLIDLDGSASADPMADPALLLARLDAAVLAGDAHTDRIRGLRDAFADRYLEQAPAPWTARLGPHHAHAALRVALYWWQHLAPDWPTRVRITLDRAWDALGRD